MLRCRPRSALALARLRGGGEQLANALDVVRSNRAGDEAVMARMQWRAARQDVQEKAAWMNSAASSVIVLSRSRPLINGSLSI